MNFLKRLFRFGARRRRDAAGPEPEPTATQSGRPAAGPHQSGLDRVFGPPESDAPIVVVASGTMTVLVDRMAYEYQHGLAAGSDPAQADLDALLPRVDRVRVLAGGMYRDHAIGTRILLDTTRRADLDAFRGVLGIIDDPASFTHCNCLGGPTLELFAAKELVATIAIHHGRSIRWYRWKHDAILRAPERLNGWLEQRTSRAEPDAPSQDNAGNPTNGPFEAGLLRLSDAERLALRGDSYRLRGDLRLALDECERALALDPQLALAHGVRGLTRLNAGRTAEAEADITEAIRRGLDTSELYLARAWARDSLGRLEDALADCDRALELAPDQAAAYNSRGLLRGRLDRVVEALADFTKARELAPDWPPPAVNRGILQLRIGHPREAAIDITEAIRLLEDAGPDIAPQRPASGQTDALSPAAYHAVRGEAYEAMGESEAALADYNKAVDLADDDPRGYLCRGRFFLRTGEPDSALDDFTEAIRLRPDLGQGYIERGQAHLAAGDPAEALDDFTEAARWSPDDPAVFFARGQVHLALGRFTEALRDFDQVVRLAPENPQGFLLRAQCVAAIGDIERKRADLEEAVRLAPGWDLACNSLAWHLATCPDPRHRDGPRSLKLAERAVRTPSNPSFHPNHLDTLAAAHAECGQFDRATVYEQQAIDLIDDPDRRASYEERLTLYQSGQPYRE
jgi:tetratricopeptide (TPR) repeat protein